MLALGLLLSCSGWAADLNPGAGGLPGGLQDSPNFAGADQRKFVLIGLALALLTVGGFAYLYLREWYTRRRLEFYRRLAAENAPALTLTDGRRESFIRASRKVVVESRPPASRTSGGPKQTQSIWVGNQLTSSSGLGSAPTTGSSSGVLNIPAGKCSPEIYVDGAFVGMAPAKLNLVEGNHTIELRQAGYKPYHKQLRMIGGAEVSLRPALEEFETEFRSQRLG